MLGVHISGFMIHAKNINRLERIMREHDPDRRVPLSLTGFLRQQVFSLKGQFVSREDIIKYVVNKAGSAHFDKNGRDETVEKIRSSVDIRLTKEGVPSFGFNLDSFSTPPADFSPDPRAIDPIFVEVLATSKFLVESQSVREYCQLLKQEYGLET